jgi:hypothetical protein
MPQLGKQIAIYPSDPVRTAIEREAAERGAKRGIRTPKLGPTCLEIIVEYLKAKKKL